MRAHDSTPSSLRAGVAALVLALAALSPATGAEDQAGWLWWRGPLGNGVSPDGDPPLRWSERENVRFKVPIDGDGLATPIVWGDRIYVLSALSLDEADEGARPATEPSEGTPLPRLRFLVTAYDRHDGSVEWQRVADERVPTRGTTWSRPGRTRRRSPTVSASTLTSAPPAPTPIRSRASCCGVSPGWA